MVSTLHQDGSGDLRRRFDRPLPLAASSDETGCSLDTEGCRRSNHSDERQAYMASSAHTVARPPYRFGEENTGVHGKNEHDHGYDTRERWDWSAQPPV